jgi:hypothetical protein
MSLLTIQREILMPAMILNDNTTWEPAPKQVAKWKTLYQGVDVDAELNAMVGWLDANPTKRKTPRGIQAFCNNWLKRAQDRGGSPMTEAKRNLNGMRTRDMSLLDELTDVSWIDDPELRGVMKGKFLLIHNQYWENGVRYVS